MSAKTQAKHEKRLARQRTVAGLTEAEIVRMHAENAAESEQHHAERRAAEQAAMREAIRRANARRAAMPKREVRKTPQPAPVLATRNKGFSFHAAGSTRVELVEEPVGTIQQGSLRAAMVEALRAGRSAMTIDELSAILKQNAKPVAAKLAQRGWLRVVKGQG